MNTSEQVMSSFIMIQIESNGLFLKNTKLHKKKPVTQNQFNALVSFAFNVGIGTVNSGLRGSTLLRLVNINPNDANISKEFLKWNKVNKVPVQGLTNRRIKESALYFTK